MCGPTRDRTEQARLAKRRRSPVLSPEPTARLELAASVLRGRRTTSRAALAREPTAESNPHRPLTRRLHDPSCCAGLRTLGRIRTGTVRPLRPLPRHDVLETRCSAPRSALMTSTASTGSPPPRACANETDRFVGATDGGTNFRWCVERLWGIEPRSSPWQADALTVVLQPQRAFGGIRTLSLVRTKDALHLVSFEGVVPREGFEPPTSP